MGNSAEEVLTHLSLHLSLSSPPPPSPSSAGTFSMMRFQATNAFARLCLLLCRGQESQKKGRVDRNKMLAARDRLSLNLKPSEAFSSLRLYKQGRDGSQKLDWRLKLFDQSFHLFPCYNTSQQPEREGSSWTGYLHSQGQNPNLLPPRGWAPPSPSGNIRRAKETQSAMCSISQQRIDRDGIMNYAAHRLDVNEGAELCFSK